MFKGEKTVTFWIGLIILGYSIYQFCLAVWQIAFYNLVYPAMIQQISGISDISGAMSSSLATSAITMQSLLTAIPGLIGGVIFLLIGLYVMKVGIKKEQPTP